MAPDPLPGPASYRAAADELDQLLADLDDDHLDVDVLADKVRRAAELIAFCRARISSARMEVEQVVADLDPPSAPPAVQPDRGADLDPAGADATAEPGDDDPTVIAPLDDDPTVVVPLDDDPTQVTEPEVTPSERSGRGAPGGS